MNRSHLFLSIASLDGTATFPVIVGSQARISEVKRVAGQVCYAYVRDTTASTVIDRVMPAVHAHRYSV
jgi:hypothetical protein